MLQEREEGKESEIEEVCVENGGGQWREEGFWLWALPHAEVGVCIESRMSVNDFWHVQWNGWWFSGRSGDKGEGMRTQQGVQVSAKRDGAFIASIHLSAPANVAEVPRSQALHYH